jgi:phage FluMu gp28-like protein
MHPLTATELVGLSRYRKTLPRREYAALEAWFSTFWPFQRPWMLDRSDMAACNKARQIGLSHSTAGLLVLWAAFHGETTTIISVGDRESGEVLDKCKLHRDVLVKLGSRMAAKGHTENKSELTFASRGRILALPSTAGRGFTGNIFLDEFAYYENRKKIWDAALAITLLGFRARVSSTPNGVGNEFHQLITDPQVSEGWSKHEIPIHEAIRWGYPVDLDKCWKLAKGDPRLFGQLFECKFLDGELQYIPTEFVERAREDFPPETQGYAFAGLDIGRTADRTELRVIRAGVDGRYHVVAQDTCKRTSQPDIDRMVRKAFQTFNIRRLCVDSTGIGAFPAEGLQRQHGRARVEPINFTLQSKEALATALYTVFAGDKIKIPRADVQLFDDICSVQRKITDAGNVQYDAPHTDAGHADSAWALALAVFAASMQPTSRSQNQSAA